MSVRSQLSKAVLMLAWLVALAGLLGISTHFKGDSTHLFGIADDREQTIRFSTPVEIVRYGYLPGEQVQAGDVIVVVRQPELDAQRKILDEKIHALKFGNREARTSMEAQIVQEKADLRQRALELDSEIRLLQSRQVATRELMQGLPEESGFADDGGLQKEIRGLQQRKDALRQSATSRIDDLQSRLTMPQRAIDAQIAELDKRSQELDRQHAEQTVLAQLSGQIGSVMFKIGDTVPPYQPVLTVHGSRPSFIKGYVHEQVINDVRLAQTVWIQSSSPRDEDRWHIGTVQSLGSRIVEFPERLKVNLLAQAWGREVVISIDNDHSLLLGEKVTVQLQPPANLYEQFKARLAQLSP